MECLTDVREGAKAGWPVTARGRGGNGWPNAVTMVQGLPTPGE